MPSVVPSASPTCLMRFRTEQYLSAGTSALKVSWRFPNYTEPLGKYVIGRFHKVYFLNTCYRWDPDTQQDGSAWPERAAERWCKFPGKVGKGRVYDDNGKDSRHVSRMYTSTFSDWFSQAVLDFTLGNRTLSVFSEFLLKLQSSDPRDLIRLSKIRTEAIATSVSRVLPEGEGLLAGWTLFSPEELNTKLSSKFEEKVLLLVG